MLNCVVHEKSFIASGPGLQHGQTNKYMYGATIYDQIPLSSLREQGIYMYYDRTARVLDRCMQYLDSQELYQNG